MKKLLTLTFILFATAQFAFSQQAIAKIKYEEAEEAYAAKNYESTLKKLDEVETILKTTSPKVMYLRIMAQSSTIENNPLNDFNILANTRKLCAKYLKNYENVPNYEDKYLDVYKMAEALNAKYPATLDEFNKKVEEKKQERALNTVSIILQKSFILNINSVNNQIIPIYKNFKKLNRWAIINKWGEIVFETNNLELGWDGKTKGMNVKDGDYFWEVSGQANNNGEFVFNGSLKIINE